MLEGDARFMLTAAIRDDYAAEPDKLSLLYVAQQTALSDGQSEQGIEAFRISGGNDQLPKALARELGDAVRLGAPVSAVERSGDGVTVGYAGGTVDADYAIVAAPLRALSSIEFSPPLRNAMSAATNRVQYGVATKVLQQYGYRFWQEDETRAATRSSTSSTTSPGRPPTTRRGRPASSPSTPPEPTAPASPRSPTGSGSTRRSASWTGSTMPRATRRAMSRPSHGSASAYTRGTWVAWAPGQMTRFYDVIAEPQGTVFFAGEHTEAYSGYMESAVRSGARVAREIRADWNS